MSTSEPEPATVLDGIDAVKAAGGSHLGWSRWREITQVHVEAFAAATGARAADGVAPYQTLALSNFFLPQIVDVRGMALGVNYGCDRIRFPASVAIGARLRAGAELTAVVDIAGGVQTTMTITVEAEGSAEPVCVIESLSRYLV